MLNTSTYICFSIRLCFVEKVISVTCMLSTNVLNTASNQYKVFEQDDKESAAGGPMWHLTLIVSHSQHKCIEAQRGEKMTSYRYAIHIRTGLGPQLR